MLKPYLLQTLKEIALLGGVTNKIELSTTELAGRLNASQQTASRYLMELDKQNLITRELGIKKQLIQLLLIRHTRRAIHRALRILVLWESHHFSDISQT